MFFSSLHFIPNFSYIFISLIFAGTHDGHILVFDIPGRGTNITLCEALKGAVNIINFKLINLGIMVSDIKHVNSYNSYI